MTKDLKIFFFGTSEFAREILSILLRNKIPVDCVITQPDAPFGRKKIMAPSAVKKYAEENNLPIQEFSKIDAKALDFFENQQPDLIITAAYGVILPKKLLDIPRLKCINVHPSLLPQLRGPAPLQYALLQGLKKTGLTIMLMDEKMDHGDILFQEEIEIGKDDTYFELENKALKTAEKQLCPVIKNWIIGKIIPMVQDHEKASLSKIIKKEDGKIDFGKKNNEIYNQYRAFIKWPKIFCFWDTKKGLRKITLHQIRPSEKNCDCQAGTVFNDSGNNLLIKTGENSILVNQLQIDGKKIMSSQDFVNGYPEIIGAKLK